MFTFLKLFWLTIAALFCFLLAAIALVSFFDSFAVAAQPFGIPMGADPEELGCNQASNVQAWICESVPKPHSDFETYAVFHAPETGVGSVVAISKAKNDSYGSQTRTFMEGIVNQLSRKYGEPTKSLDYLKRDSIWDDPNDWERGVYVDERVYAFLWQNLNIDNVTGIVFTATADHSGVATKLQFAFENFNLVATPE